MCHPLNLTRPLWTLLRKTKTFFYPPLLSWPLGPVWVILLIHHKITRFQAWVMQNITNNIFLCFFKTYIWEHPVEKLKMQRQIQLQLWRESCSASSWTWRHTNRTGSSSGRKSASTVFPFFLCCWTHYLHSHWCLIVCVHSGHGRNWKRYYKVGCRPLEEMNKWKEMLFVKIWRR